MSNLDSKSAHARGVNINFGNMTGNVADLDLKNMNLNAGAVAANSLNDAANSLGSCARISGRAADGHGDINTNTVFPDKNSHVHVVSDVKL